MHKSLVAATCWDRLIVELGRTVASEAGSERKPRHLPSLIRARFQTRTHHHTTVGDAGDVGVNSMSSRHHELRSGCQLFRPTARNRLEAGIETDTLRSVDVMIAKH
jgi:hypothetical protein